VAVLAVVLGIVLVLIGWALRSLAATPTRELASP
jgi:hypothetical protein